MTTRTYHHRATFLDTHTLVFWVGAGLVVFGTIRLWPLVVSALIGNPAVAVMAAMLWGLYGLALAVIVYRLELFERRSPVTMLGAFVWGGVVVSGISAVAAAPMHDIFAKLLGSAYADWIPAISAPLLEEPLKMLGVVALAFIPGARINSPLDGLFFGLIVGLGFEVTESFLYTATAGTPGVDSLFSAILTFVLRAIVGGLWNHATFTAITGAGVGYFFGSPASALRRWFVMIGALIVAISLHGLFDSPTVEAASPVVSSLVKGLPALVLLLILWRIARRREQALFEQIGETRIPRELVGHDELETLLEKRERRRARRALRRRHGFAASRALRRLQRAQIELVSEVGSVGADTPRAIALAEDITRDRSELTRILAPTP